jgi:hypothetical protein
MSDYEQTTETPVDDSAEKPFEAFVRHQRKAFDEANKALDALVPPGFKEHGKEAGREFVKGLKVLADAALAEMEKASRDFEKNFNRERPADEEGGADRPSSTGATKVKVQVE